MRFEVTDRQERIAELTKVVELKEWGLRGEMAGRNEEVIAAATVTGAHTIGAWRHSRGSSESSRGQCNKMGGKSQVRICR